MGQEIKIRIKPYKTAKIRIKPQKSGNPSSDLDLGNFRNWDKIFCADFSRKNPKIKEKNINLRKNKNKKLGQEIKIRKTPQKSAKTAKIRRKPEILTKNLSFFERFSLTHSGGSSVSLGTIINS